MSLGLEDDAPQVEINFNVDTDENGAPMSPVDQDGDQNVEAAKTDAIEAEAEVEQAETEQEELEEAQEALESLKVVLDKAAMTGGLSPIAMEMFKIAMTRITGSKELVEQVTMESAFTSPVQRQLEAAKLVEVSLESLETVSMEGVKELLAKMFDVVEKFFALEKSVVKRANALLQLADTRDGEHSTSKTIPVNVKRGLKSKYLAHTEYKSEKEILDEVGKAVKLFKSIKVPSLDGIDTDNVAATLFNLSPSDWDRQTTKKGTFDSYSFFAVNLRKGKLLTVDLEPVNKSLNSLPVLTTKTAKEVLNQVLELSKSTTTLKQIVKELKVDPIVRDGFSVNYDNGQYSHTYKIDPKAKVMRSIAKGLVRLIKYRTKVMDELVNYCGMCIQDRGVDSPSSND